MLVTIPANQRRPLPTVPPKGLHTAIVITVEDFESEIVEATFEFRAENRVWRPSTKMAMAKIKLLAKALGMTGDIDTADMAGQNCRIRIKTFGGRRSYEIEEFLPLPS